ncbi:DNA polymerase [Caballeronia terrestris]|jgi:hypothetical protein|uniref:DNA polymerase n=1 Tax=Caballeronia terrestris TaxID=1226301 RepID=A0A158L1Y2_9BURK|nr:hypothetical protein [Caballeronia terrestris]SAL87394.1 DNA polymerase [Caballeronia terrestris]
MAAWKRKGRLQQYDDRIVNDMHKRDYDKALAEAIFDIREARKHPEQAVSGQYSGKTLSHLS